MLECKTCETRFYPYEIDDCKCHLCGGYFSDYDLDFKIPSTFWIDHDRYPKMEFKPKNGPKRNPSRCPYFNVDVDLSEEPDLLPLRELHPHTSKINLTIQPNELTAEAIYDLCCPSYCLSSFELNCYNAPSMFGLYDPAVRYNGQLLHDLTDPLELRAAMYGYQLTINYMRLGYGLEEHQAVADEIGWALNVPLDLCM